jgi:protein ImuA
LTRLSFLDRTKQEQESGSMPSIAELRRLVRTIEGGGSALDTLSLGATLLDAGLPWGGLPLSGVHELLGPAGDGARTGFLAHLLARLAGQRGPLLWCRTPQAEGELYGPGLIGLGLDPARLVLVRAKNPVDALWAMEQGLRARCLGAVIGDGLLADPIAVRRLQLASEDAGVPLFLLPPGDAEPASPVAVTRWRIASVPAAQWHIELLRCRGGVPSSWTVEKDDASLHVHLAASLGDRPLAAAG